MGRTPPERSRELVRVRSREDGASVARDLVLETSNRWISRVLNIVSRVHSRAAVGGARNWPGLALRCHRAA